MHYYGVNFRHGGYLRFVMLEQLDREKNIYAGYAPLNTTSSHASAASNNSVDEFDAEAALNGLPKKATEGTADDLAGFTLARQTSSDSLESLNKENGNGKIKKRANMVELFQIQSDLLRECLTRTLKCMLREVQRDWIRSQKTASEQGLKHVIVQFLNVVSDSHPNSKAFWEEMVPNELIQRFGELSLMGIPKAMASVLTGRNQAKFEHDDARIFAWMGLNMNQPLNARVLDELDPSSKKIIRLWDIIRYDSAFLFSVVSELCEMCGVKLSSDCEIQRDNYKTMLESQLHGLEADNLPTGTCMISASPRYPPASPYPYDTPVHRRDGSYDDPISLSKAAQRSIPKGRASSGSPSLMTPKNEKHGFLDEVRPSRAASVSGKSVARQRDSGSFGYRRSPSFIFVVADIDDLVPVVKHLHQLDLVTGTLLKLQVEKYFKNDQYVVAIRMLKTAIDTLFRARRAVPDDVGTRHELADAFHMLATTLQKQSIADSHLKGELETALQRWADESMMGGQFADEQLIQKLRVQLKDLKDSMERNKPAWEQARSTSQHLLDMDKHACCQHSKGSRVSYRGNVYALSPSYRHILHLLCLFDTDDLIGIMVEVTYAYPKENQPKDGQYLPFRKINDIVFRPGCVCLGYFRQQLYPQSVQTGRDSADADSVSTGRKDVSPQTLNLRFIPVIIDPEHAARALPLLKEELVRMDRLPMGRYESCIYEDQGPVRAPSDLRIRPYGRAGLPEFTPEIGFRVIAALMNASIVKICRAAAKEAVKSADVIVGKYY
jgi:hypothetical protein